MKKLFAGKWSAGTLLTLETAPTSPAESVGRTLPLLPPRCFCFVKFSRRPRMRSRLGCSGGVPVLVPVRASPVPSVMRKEFFVVNTPHILTPETATLFLPIYHSCFGQGGSDSTSPKRSTPNLLAPGGAATCDNGFRLARTRGVLWRTTFMMCRKRALPCRLLELFANLKAWSA